MEGIVSQAEQTAVKAKQQAQEYLDGIVQSIEAERCENENAIANNRI